jgi:hypothetical protein
MQDKPIMQQDWREVPRSEMFERVITAVDSSRGEAEALDNPEWMRYCEHVLFPFLEAEQEKARASESDYGQDLRYLTEWVGVSEEEARLMLRDRDLWIIDPATRYDPELEGEEGVKLWEGVVDLAEGFSELAANRVDLTNPAATQLIHDAAVRAKEALRRARERVEGVDE